MNEILLSFAPYALVTAFTPGPNNVLALSAVAGGGWEKGKAVVAGISAGFSCVMLLCALGCFGLARYLPLMAESMKYVGAVYIGYLAVRIALSKPDGEGAERKKSFWAGFFLQFVNVKIILYAITIYTGYVIPVSPSSAALLTAALCSAVIGISGTMTWALAGGVLKKQIRRHYRPFNAAMALILLWSAGQLIFA